METNNKLIFLKRFFVFVLVFNLFAITGIMGANRTFTGAVNSDFDNPLNWDGGVTIPTTGDNIMLAATITINSMLDENGDPFVCGDLRIMEGASFSCIAPNTFTISGNIYDTNGKVVIAVTSAITISSSISFPNVSEEVEFLPE